MIVMPGVYKHYKGALYVVVGVARHHENGREYAVYHPVEPHDAGTGIIELNVRPLHGHDGDEDGFLDPVDVGFPTPRFELVALLNLNQRGRFSAPDVRGGR